MRRLLRRPIVWVVVAEFIVVGALIVVAWNAVGSVARPVLASPPLEAAAPAENRASPVPGLPAITKPERGPLPGLSLNSAFWRERLERLNREQVSFEQLEWQVVRSALDAAQRYLQTVVAPSIERAERR